MKIDHLVLGAYETNCYILRSDDTSGDCVVIDTGLRAEKIVEFLRENKLNPAAVILTHGHIDHIRGLALLRAEYPQMKVYIHETDSVMLAEPKKNLSGELGPGFTTEAADFLVNDGDLIELAQIKLRVIHTPGHTPGGICLYSAEEKKVFTGDTLFAGSVGRTDFYGGDGEQLIHGIKEKLLILADDTICYPGHGESTTIAEEKLHNPFLQ